MSYIDQNVLKGFYSDNHWITKANNIDQMNDLIEQVDNEIQATTGIETPADPQSTDGILRNIACCLFVFYAAGKQGELSDNEYKQREKLFDDAKERLKHIAAGEIIIKDDEGNALNSRTSKTTFVSTKRISLI